MKQTPEELSLYQALEEGTFAGLMNKSWSENPYQAGLPEHKKWKEGWEMAAQTKLAGMTVAA